MPFELPRSRVVAGARRAFLSPPGAPRLYIVGRELAKDTHVRAMDVHQFESP